MGYVAWKIERHILFLAVFNCYQWHWNCCVFYISYDKKLGITLTELLYIYLYSFHREVLKIIQTIYNDTVNI